MDSLVDRKKRKKVKKIMNKQNSVENIAAKHLGQKGGEGYSDQYDPSLLVRIPRNLNREAYDIEENNLPFVGYDLWNAYEVSTLTEKGLPVNGVMKILISSDSKYHVESKSLKLYLNSYNMTKRGKTAENCRRLTEKQVSEDLSLLLEVKVEVRFETEEEDILYSKIRGFVDLKNESKSELEEIRFNSYGLEKDDLQILKYESKQHIKWKSDLLRSNCRVTHQPDWGDIYIEIEGKNIPKVESLAEYIVSHRTVSHFHEEICEMVYKHLYDILQPEKLMVACLYTRRGGIDINPIRASHYHLIPPVFKNKNLFLLKSLRQ